MAVLWTFRRTSQARIAQTFPPSECPSLTTRSAGHGPNPSSSQAAVAAISVLLTCNNISSQSLPDY